METGRLSSHNNLETATFLENLGSCCEGTVFTFTSAGSKWRLRQRLNRNKASLLNPHGGPILREDPADSVFTEMRMMPRSSETNPSESEELWNRTKYLTSTRSEEPSRENNMAYHDTGDLRSYRRVCRLSGQMGGDPRAKVVPQEAMKANNERKELQVFVGETTARKSRRYLRCDNFRERYKYGYVGEDDKTWLWTEKKLEDVRAQEERRRNKRESCTEEIHVFEQRKVRCRRKDQDSCSSHSEGMQSEDLFKADDVNRGSYGSNNREGVAEERKKQQAGQVAAITAYVANESTKNRKGPSMETAGEIEDRCSNYLPKQKPLPQLQYKRGNAAEENRPCIMPRPEIISPSTPPIACSFISFKAGVPRVGNRRYHILGDASLRARPFPDEEYCDGNETQSQILRQNRLCQDRSADALSSPTKWNGRSVEPSSKTISAEMGGDSQTNTGTSDNPEAICDSKSTGREREKEMVVLSETVASRSSHTVGQEVSLQQKPVGPPQELPCSWSLRVTEGSSDREGDMTLRWPHKSSWERNYITNSKPKYTLVNEGECGTQRMNVFQLNPSKLEEGPRDRLSSRPLDWYGSSNVEDGLEVTDIDGSDQRSNGRDSDDEFASYRGADGPSSVQGRVELRDDSSECSLDGINNLHSAEVSPEPSDVSNIYMDDVNGDNEEKSPNEIANDTLRKPHTLELERSNFREDEKGIPDGKHSTESRCTSGSEKVRAETVEIDTLPQKSAPWRRQPWVKGFKRKTGEKVGYFESWLGRRKKDLSTKKPYRTSPGEKCGPNGVGELSQADQALAPKVDDKHDKCRPFGHSVDKHLISPAWSTKESQAYVTKEFEILEAVLQSEVAIDDDDAKLAEYSEHPKMMSSDVVGIADSIEGRRQERGTMTGQTNSESLNCGNINTVAANLETKNDLVHVRYSVGYDSPFDRGEQESSHVAGVSNNKGGQETERKKTLEEREDPLMPPHRKASGDDLNVVSERTVRPQNLNDHRLMSEKGLKTSLEKSTERDVCSQKQDMPPCASDAQGLSMAEQCRFLFEKRCNSQERNLSSAHDKVAEGMKPPFPNLTVLTDSTDTLIYKVLDSSDVAIGEGTMPDKFGPLATEISGLAQHTGVGRVESRESCPSDVATGSGNCSESVDRPGPTESSDWNRVNGASSAFRQQVSAPVLDSRVVGISKHCQQVKSSSGQVVQSPRESKRSQRMVGSDSKSVCTEGHFPPQEATVEYCDGLTESETVVKVVDPERSSANFTSGIDVDQFPSSIEVPAEKEIVEADKRKNRRHKTPIIVRVRNRLANGWSLQHSLWKRVAKQKMKTGESQVLATKGTKKLHADSSSLSFGTGSSLNPLHESRTEDVINTNPASSHRTEQTIASTPQILILDEHRKQCAATANEKFHQSCSGDLDTGKCHSRIYDIQSKQATSEMYEVGERNEINAMKSPPSENHDEIEMDPTEKDYCPDQATSVLSFAEWQSRATGFRKASPSSEKVKVNTATPNKKREEKPNEFNDVGELLSVVCLGNTVKEATVLGAFCEFDTGYEVPMVIGQGENGSGGFPKVSDIDGCDEERTPVCPGKPGKVLAVSQMYSDRIADEHIISSNSEESDIDGCDEEITSVYPGKRGKALAVSQKSSDRIAEEHIINNNSDVTKRSYCQTEPRAEDGAPEEKQSYIPLDSPPNSSVENCCPSSEEGAESEESQEYESLQKYFSLNDQNEGLHTCSTASLGHACGGSPYISGRMPVPSSHTEDSIDGQPEVDCRNDNLNFPPQVPDVLDYLSVEPTLDEPAPPASFQCQPCVGTADDEKSRPLPSIVQLFGQAGVEEAPSCPPLKIANFGGKQLVWDDCPKQEIEMEDLTWPGNQVRGMPEDDQPTSCLPPAHKAPGDLKHWELLEMLKMPNNQTQVLHSHKPKDSSSKDSQGHVSRTGQKTDSWESSYQKDCGKTHGTLCWKAESTQQTAKDLSTEEQIFLERFSATSNKLFKSCKLPPKRPSSRLRFESLPSSVRPSSPDLRTQMRLFSAPAILKCGRTESLPFGRSFEPSPLPSEVQLINPLPPCASKRRSLSDVGGPDSSHEYKHEGYNAFEPRLLPDYAPSFDCLSPSSSINRSLDMSERHFTRARPCPDCLNTYEHREAWVEGGTDGVHDWKPPATQECVPSLTMQGFSFPARCQSLLLNPRQSSCESYSSQSSTQCRCDPCNTCHYSPSVLLSCHHPPCIAAVQHHSQCHFPGHSQPWEFRKTSVPCLHGPNAQYLKKDAPHPYSPLQVMQKSGIPTTRPWCYGDSQRPLLQHERHQFADKNRATEDCQVGGQSQSNRTKGNVNKKELVWLSEQEMNLMRQLRLSGEKAAAVCRHDAAACIQRNWRKYFEKKTEDQKLEKGQQALAWSLLTEYPMRHDGSKYCKLRPVAASLQSCGSSPKELSRDHLAQREYSTMQKAASIIQHHWRSVLMNRKEKLLTGREWPKDLKTFYDIIKIRLVTRGRPAPSFDLFSRSVQRIQAATEGARVRRRLKSHRLQTIVMEIKEIRMLLYEMSQEEKSNSTPFLFPQLCTQLRQKISQLHAALNGKQMEARFLLRRCPATPLTIPPSGSTSPKPIYMVPSQKSVDHALVKLSLSAIGARKFYNPPLTNPASVASDSTITQSVPLIIQTAVPPEQKFIHTQSFVPLIQASKGNAIRLLNSSPDPPDSDDPPDSAKLLQLYLLAQKSPSKRVGGRGTPNTDVSSGHEANVKKEVIEKNHDPSQKKHDLQSFSSHKSSPKSKEPESSLNKNFDELPLPVHHRRRIPEMSFEEMAVGVSNASMYLTEYAPSSDSTDKPKRPFLKRKSIAMPSQKLDWSKVKPMVSSRLEPELKTKLSLCKGPAKEPAKVTSKKKKANYSNVKSRLFSYEENVSPSNSRAGSRDGTCLRSHTTEASDSGYPPMLRSSARGSSIQGTDNGRYSRVLTNRQRAASPDLMHLRSSMAAADRRCSQTSMVETQSVATYSSHFDSARYLHKVGSSERTAKGTLGGSRQQRTQKSIRLRILPGSKECPVGDLFVQEEMQEIWEDQSLSANGKGKRQQSHSHRYAIYQEQDARFSSRVADTTSPYCAEEDRKVTATFSREEIQKSLRHEVYKYFETNRGFNSR